ncbi:hypothetical protein [Actinocorallia longicatena]|uniref:ARB-07466-like C-terminal domain-containing protein n=1 Tax=Actinocorallia longicatena TaxID=111803 RepID=A0ABP6QER7_9ACTN
MDEHRKVPVRALGIIATTAVTVAALLPAASVAASDMVAGPPECGAGVQPSRRLTAPRVASGRGLAFEVGRRPYDGCETSAFTIPDQQMFAGRSYLRETFRGGNSTRTLAVRQTVRRLFPLVADVGCLRRGDPQDHGTGHACDYMISSLGRPPDAPHVCSGYEIANWATAHSGEYGIKYVIYRQHIWNPDRAREGWRLMADRGGLTANHFDHVHISIFSDAELRRRGGVLRR